MKRVIFGALDACFAFSAFAQSTYSQAVEQQQRCSMYGEMWQEVKTSNTIGGKPLEYYSKEHRAGRIEESVFMKIVMTFIYARSDSLRTPQDAYMKGWAECMDGK